MEIGKKGRPRSWGKLRLTRPRIPVEIAAKIDEILDLFVEPEEAQEYILECLNQKCQMQRLRLYDWEISATPGITGYGEDSSYEEIEVPRSLLRNPDKSFLVRVSGDSMKDAGINRGDVILVKQINPLFDKPLDKEIVTAVVDDSELVVKRYRCRHNKYELLSENRNRNYPPIQISNEMSDHHSVYIFGVFQRVIPLWLIGK